METKDYTVTKLAGPKVAGVPVKAGDVIKLTEAQARSELLDGAIVEGADKAAARDAAKPGEPSKELADIQARARGLDAAPEVEPAAKPAEPKPVEPPKVTAPAAGAPAPKVGA